MSAPLVVNTADGTVWTRRGSLSDGRALYAPADVCMCPQYVMATEAELAEHGITGVAYALPMPVSVEPEVLTVERLAEIRKHVAQVKDWSPGDLAAWDLLREVDELRVQRDAYCDRVDALSSIAAGNQRHAVSLTTECQRLAARVAELEAERRRYVGAEPTIAEEMAYLGACTRAVAELRVPESLDVFGPEYRGGYAHALADVRAALESPERTSYPPALPWAELMDDDDLTGFLDELADAAIVHADPLTVLAQVEEACIRWRTIAEAQHAHNTAPGPDVDGITRAIAPVQALQPEDGVEAGDAS